MNPYLAGTGVGAGLGGMLGQVGETLSMPRRALMSMLGLPDSGAQLASDLTGMAPDSIGSKLLGFTAEAALDPLTYLGAGLGRLGGGVWNKANQAEAALTGQIDELGRAGKVAQEGMWNRELANIGRIQDAGADYANLQNDLQYLTGKAAANEEAYRALANRLRVEDLPEILSGNVTRYSSVDPGAVEYLQRTGLGTAVGDGVDILGSAPPVGFERLPLASGARPGQFGGSMLGNRSATWEAMGLRPEDLRELMDQAYALEAGGAPIGSIHNPNSIDDLLNSFVANRSAAINAPLTREIEQTRSLMDALGEGGLPFAKAMNESMPVPNMAQHMAGAGVPAGNLPWDFLQTPLTDAQGKASSMIAELMRRQQGMRMGGKDYAQIAAGFGLGGLLGAGMYAGGY